MQFARWDLGFVIAAPLSSLPAVVAWLKVEASTGLRFVRDAFDEWCDAPIELRAVHRDSYPTVRPPVRVDSSVWDKVAKGFAAGDLASVNVSPTMAVAPDGTGPPFTENIQGPAGIGVDRVDRGFLGRWSELLKGDGYAIEFWVITAWSEVDAVAVASVLNEASARATTSIGGCRVVHQIGAPLPVEPGSAEEAKVVAQRLREVFGRRLLGCDPYRAPGRLAVEILNATDDELGAAVRAADIPAERLIVLSSTHTLDQRAAIARELRPVLDLRNAERPTLAASVASIADGEIVISARDLDDETIIAIERVVPPGLVRFERLPPG